jgi:MYXO-CTERM domain-containing protein
VPTAYCHDGGPHQDVDRRTDRSDCDRDPDGRRDGNSYQDNGGGVFTLTPTHKPTPRTLDDDGCAVVSPTDGSAGWMLLLPAAMLLWVRRRTR